MTVFSVSNCDWFHGCVALRAEHLDVFRVMKVQVFWNPDGDKMVRLSHLSLTLVRYVSHYCLHRSREAQGGSGSGSASRFYCVYLSPDLERVWQNVSKSWAWDKKIGPISTKQAVRHLCFWTAPFFFCKEHSVLVFPMYWNHATLMLLVLAFFALLSYFKSGAVFWQRQWGFSSLAKSRFRSWNSFLVCTKICFIMFQMFLCRFGMVHQKEHQKFHQKWSCSDDIFFCFKLWLVPWLCRTSRWTFGCFSGHESSGFLKPRWWQDGPFKSFKFDTRQVCQSLLSSPKSWSSRRQWVGKCESLLLCLFESRFGACMAKCVQILSLG